MRLNYQLRKWIVEKVEQYIQEYTMNCSNLNKTVYQPWLTPDQARAVAKIAREETIKEVCEWLEDNLPTYISYCERGTGEGSAEFIEDLKKHFNIV